MKYKYTEKEYDELLRNMVIIIDTREQKNQHITKYFDQKNIKWENKKLTNGDYNFKIKANSLGFTRDTYFTDSLVIERKAHLSELAGNLSDASSRLLRELGRCATIPHCHLIVENDTIDDIIKGNYNSKMNSIGFLRSILTIGKTYGFNFDFISKENSGLLIYELCKNELDSFISK